MLAQLQSRFRRNVQARAGGHVVQDDRDAAGFGHGGKVSHQTRLAGLVVVRGHQQQGVRAAGSRFCRQCTAMIGIVGTCTCHDGDAVVDRIDREFDGSQLLLIGHGRALAGGAADDNGVRSPCDLILNDTAQLVKIDTAVLIHRGDNGDSRTRKDRILHAKKLLCSALCAD
jgi:hypothetical protein